MSQKTGARHNKRDQEIIDNWHKRADELKADMSALGAAIEAAADAKGDDLPAPEPDPVVWGAIKAVGDGWTLRVLGVPFGGPHNGKDAHGEYFTPRTKTHHARYPRPLIAYYHGYTPDGRPQGEPVEIAEGQYALTDAKGHWYDVALNQAVEYAHRVRDAALKGLARASSGTIGHLKRVAADGEILNWPVVELSIFDTDGKRQPANAYAVALPSLKSRLAQAGLDLPDFADSESQPETDTTGAIGPVAVVPDAPVAPSAAQKTTEITNMDPKEVEAMIAAGIASAMKAQQDAAAVEAERKQKEDERIAQAVKAQVDEVKKRFAANGRLPLGEAPHQAQFGDTRKYDNLDAADQALLVQVLGGKLNGIARQAPEAALKALALKLAEDKERVGEVGRQAMKAAGIKADEVQQQDLTGFGDEWVAVAYGQSLWDAVRADSYVAANLPSIEVPAGHESIFLPLEGADPTFYKVAETTDTNATTKVPNANVTSSQMATARKQLTLAKMGARVLWSGELEEDSIIPFVRQLRMQLQKAGAEQLDYAIIDGDTDATASTNINDIAGTPAATDLFLLFNGFRKSCLVTTTANSRSASGSFVVTDFINTVKLLGTAGMAGYDKRQVSFIVDPNTYWKALELPEVKTRDAFASPTIESGELTSIFGYRLRPSWFMHYIQTDRKANTAGKVDQDTAGNNTTGAILAVRWDHWKLGYRRRMTVETTRFANSDTTEITALMRLGLVQRDTEASAITYNVGI